jgi:glutaredoxin 3
LLARSSPCSQRFAASSAAPTSDVCELRQHLEEAFDVEAIEIPSPKRSSRVATSARAGRPGTGSGRSSNDRARRVIHTGSMTSRVVLFSTQSCTYCVHAKSLLSKRGVVFDEVDLSEHPELQAELTSVTGLESFPQIVVNGEPLGGLNELRAADASGVLASWSAA